MARSLWKGKIFVKEFLKPAYQVNKVNYFKLLKPLKIQNINPASQLDELKIYRRSHQLLHSQLPVMIALSPYSLYNGYDFIRRSIPTNILLGEVPISLNLGGGVSTREMEVTHKIKLSKAARKTNAKLKKRTTLTKVNNTKVGKKKPTLSKKIKK